MALTPAQVAAKWKARSSGSSEFYRMGVAGAGQKYNEGVSRAEPAYEQGVTEAMSRKAWGKRTANKGTVYSQKASTKGVTNWTTGIASGEADFLTEATPFLELGQHLQLSPPGAKGSPQNMQRAIEAAQQFRALKLSRQGA